jgi:hypothetical protein
MSLVSQLEKCRTKQIVTKDGEKHGKEESTVMQKIRG